LVNLILVAINLITSPGDLWFYWVTAGWGIALAVQAWTIFSSTSRSGRSGRAEDPGRAGSSAAGSSSWRRSAPLPRAGGSYVGDRCVYLREI